MSTYVGVLRAALLEFQSTVVLLAYLFIYIRMYTCSFAHMVPWGVLTWRPLWFSWLKWEVLLRRHEGPIFFDGITVGGEVPPALCCGSSSSRCGYIPPSWSSKQVDVRRCHSVLLL